MASLKKELKKLIAAELESSAVSPELRDRILKNADSKNPAQLMDIMDTLLSRHSPKLLTKQKKTLEKKLNLLKTQADAEIKKITPFLPK